MGIYRIEWKASALKELKRIERDTVPRIFAAVEALASEPRPGGCRKLAGASMTYRLRVRRYRVVYTIEDERLVVQVIRVGTVEWYIRNRSSTAPTPRCAGCSLLKFDDDVASMFPDDRSVNDGLIREAVASADQDSFVSRQAPITYTVPGT